MLQLHADHSAAREPPTVNSGLHGVREAPLQVLGAGVAAMGLISMVYLYASGPVWEAPLHARDQITGIR